MILEEAQLKVRSSGIASTTFGISLNRKMFKILSADLYSDQIAAVIRELSTNAADSHVAAGKKTVPFEVHLPNFMEPWFAVTDFGTGLSPEQMLTIYTQYGASNKTDSNEQTGCLGLGSKSPFAYTDSFTVESRYNGKQYTYTAYMNSEGFPSLSDIMTETDTTESSGLTVKFAVRNSDFDAFVEKAKNILRWFKTRPIVKGNSKFVYPAATELMIDNDNYSVPKERTNRSVAVMGNVAYPLDSYRIIKNVKGKEYDNIRAILEYGIVIKVNIGEVDITASREQLAYDETESGGKKTISTLVTKLTAAVKDMQEVVTKDIASAPTLWEAGKKLHDVRRMFYSFDFNAKWNGKEVKLQYTAPINTELWSDRGYSGRMKVRESGAINLSVGDIPVVKVNSKSAKAVIRHYMKTKGVQIVYVIGEDSADYATVLTELGLKPLYTADMEKPPRKVGVRTTAEKSTVYKFAKCGRLASDCWEAVEIDSEDDSEFLYVNILRYNITEEGKEDKRPDVLEDVINFVEKLTNKKITVYGVRPADIEKLEKNTEGTWTPLNDYLKTLQQEQSVKFQADVDKTNKQNSIGHCYIYNRFKSYTGLANTAIGNYVAEVEKVKSKYTINFGSYRNLCTYVGVDINKVDTTLTDMRDSIQTKYPLLQEINDYYRSDSELKVLCKKLSDYMKMVDNATVNQGQL